MTFMQRTPRWLLTWILTLAIAGSGWLAFERYWRAEGYQPTVMDSRDLWSQFRDRVVCPSPPLRVALLGASRIQYGLAPDVFRDEARGTDPSMLAVNGHYPIIALKDLADDVRFKGVVIVGVDSRGLDKRLWNMQAPYVQHYRHDWSPARMVHRRLLTEVQQYAIAARPDFAGITLIKRYLDHQGPPYKEYVTFQRDRAGGTDYAKSDLQGIRQHRINDLKQFYPSFIPPTPEQWLNDMREVATWAEKINARGGRVVFYREPVSDEHLQMDEEKFPRALYWDRLNTVMPATMIDFRDYPELNNIPTPDTSHIDMKDIDRHTRGLVRVLKAKGVLPAQ